MPLYTSKITLACRNGGMADAPASGAGGSNIVWVQVPFPAGLRGGFFSKAVFLFGGTMKYLKQLTIILIVSLISEALGYFIPLPVPASVYGLILMFILLCTKVIKLEAVEDVADFLIKVMPFIFVAPTVALMTSFDIIKGKVLWLFIMCFVSTIAVTAVTGLVAQLIIRIKKKGGKKNA